MSMLAVKILAKIDERLRQIKGNEAFFGNIPFIVIVGDFRQLCPGVGGVKSTINNVSILYGTIPFEIMLQSFVKKDLVGQMRAEGNMWQQTLVDNCNEQTYPTTLDLFTPGILRVLPSIIIICTIIINIIDNNSKSSTEGPPT